MRYYNPVYFKPYEYLPPIVFNTMGEHGISLMDPRILWTWDQLRIKIGKRITINNWKDGGPFEQRGFRFMSTQGALLSQHKFGRACDGDIEGITAAEFREDVKKGVFDEQLKYVTFIEDKINWIHLDCRASAFDRILFIEP